MIEINSYKDLSKVQENFASLKPPKVCIGMPLFNESHHLESTLHSILNQSFHEYVLIISDNCSTDTTPQIIRRLCKTDTRTILIRNKSNIGMVNNFRLTIRFAKKMFPQTQFSCWVSGHDQYERDWLESVYMEINKNPNAVVVYTRAKRTSDQDSTPTKPAFDNSSYYNLTQRVLYTLQNLRGSGIMAYGLFRINDLIKAGIYRETLTPDVFLMKELSIYGKAKLIDHPLYVKRPRAKNDVDLLHRQRMTLYSTCKPPLTAFIPLWLYHPLLFAQLYYNKLGMNAIRFALIMSVSMINESITKTRKYREMREFKEQQKREQHEIAKLLKRQNRTKRI